MTPPTPPITFRHATLSDLTALTDFCLPQIRHDGFHDYFFPNQDAYPHDMYRWWYAYFRMHMLRPYVAVLIAEMSEDAIEGEGEGGVVSTHSNGEKGAPGRRIVGLVVWTFEPRAGSGGTDSPKPKGIDLAKDSCKESLQRGYYGFLDTVSEMIFPNRAAYGPALAEWSQVIGDISRRYFSGEDRVHWMLYELFFAPEHREAMLELGLRWGFERADADGVRAWGACRTTELGEYAEHGIQKVAGFTCGPLEAVLLRRNGGKGQ
ncbi:hypothetical protein K439DRAFT_1664565 [Ramaria rubella]|nr:hypothetical protein K439DRAFT_1664565 [Ramaria rubella]